METEQGQIATGTYSILRLLPTPSWSCARRTPDTPRARESVGVVRSLQRAARPGGFSAKSIAVSAVPLQCGFELSEHVLSVLCREAASAQAPERFPESQNVDFFLREALLGKL
jgi:hypothetical protein